MQKSFVIGKYRIKINVVRHTPLKHQNIISLSVYNNRGNEVYQRECSYYKTARNVVNALIKLKRSDKINDKLVYNWLSAV